MDRANAIGSARMSDPEDKTGPAAPENRGISRRDVVAALSGIPVFGAFVASYFAKKAREDARRQTILSGLGVGDDAPEPPRPSAVRARTERLRLGFIGFGGEGESLARAAGFAHPDWPKKRTEPARRFTPDTRLTDFLGQDDLNVELYGVCDVFDLRAERAQAAARNPARPGGAAAPNLARRFRDYREMLDCDDIDAVVIATPDHWHAQMVVDAVQAGKHVYCEKCMTRTEEEVWRVADAVRGGNVVFQLGHQNRQLESHKKAREVVKRNVLGRITLVETTTNRNDKAGAWVYDILRQGTPQTIDWEQFQGPAPTRVPFSPERFFRWRCWYDYGTGLAGDLLSHEFDAVNQILDLGIPRSATASGGIYFFKDGREVPDVFQVVFEYPERELTLVYSATLANGRARGKVFMGHDASMEVGNNVRVMVDSGSTRYKDWLKQEVVDTDHPLLSYRPGHKGVDAVTSATEEYFASRGLLFTYQGGRRVSTLHLHVKEWLDCIRGGGEPSCNIERGIEEAITCHMATASYRLGRKVEWDQVKKQIV
jgi:predicted dehydrogenase